MPFFEQFFNQKRGEGLKKSGDSDIQQKIELPLPENESKEKIGAEMLDMVYEYDTIVGESKLHSLIVYEKSEKFAIKSKNWVFDFTIEPVSLETINSIPQLRNKANPAAWRTINALNCKNIETKEMLFSLENMLPRDWKILFTPTEEWVPPEYQTALEKKYISSGYINEEEKCVILHGNLSKAGAILTIFHELGHVNQNVQELAENDSSLKDMLVRIKIRPDTIKENPQRYNQALKQLLKLELNAWLFTLNTLEPLIKDGSINKDYVFDYIKKAVRTYAITEHNKRLIARFCDSFKNYY